MNLLSAGVALSDFADDVTATFEEAWCTVGKEVSLQVSWMMRSSAVARVEFEADRVPWHGEILPLSGPARGRRLPMCYLASAIPRTR